MTSREKIADMLDETKWGADFSRDEIEAIAPYFSVSELDKDQHVFEEGDKENFMAFIISGEIIITKELGNSSEKIVCTLKAGTHFGELSFIDDGPRSASAVASQPSTLLTLSKSNFDVITLKHPAIGVKILTNIAKLISGRLRMTTGRLVYLQS